MLVILARHGNTFEAGETPVWVGAREDIPLTDKGRGQARAMGEALLEASLALDRLICGPLKRTREGAQIIAEIAGAGAPEIDDRLREIDYGAWGGKSDAEIAERWGEAAIAAWRERNEVPNGAGWSPDPSTLAANARAVLDDVRAGGPAHGAVLILTSNGILRFFHQALAGAGSDPARAKVKTGHWGAARLALDRDSPVGDALVFWNQPPGAADLTGAGD